LVLTKAAGVQSRSFFSLRIDGREHNIERRVVVAVIFFQLDHDAVIDGIVADGGPSYM